MNCLLSPLGFGMFVSIISQAALTVMPHDEVSPLLRRLDAETRTLLFGRRQIKVKRPSVAADEVRSRAVAGLRSLAEHPLVSKRVLVEKAR